MKNTKLLSLKVPYYFSPLAKIPDSIELLENSLTYEGVQWKKLCHAHSLFIKYVMYSRQMQFGSPSINI